MIRRLFRRGIRIGAIVGAIAFLVQIFLRNPAPKRSDTEAKPAGRTTPPPQPKLTPKSAPAKAKGKGKATTTATTKAPATATDNGVAPAEAQKPKPEAEADTAASATAWADPVDGGCPSGYPVKVKLASGIFHVPGGLAYDRTAPDRCYVSADAAEKDGFRQSKR